MFGEEGFKQGWRVGQRWMEFAVVINYRRLGRSFRLLYCSNVLNFLKLKTNVLFIENKILLWEYRAKAKIYPNNMSSNLEYRQSLTSLASTLH